MAQITLNSSGVASSGSLLLQTNGTTTQATLDTSGNLGLGVTPSAWFANSKSIQLGQGSFIEGRANNYTVTEVGSNVYLNSAGNWTYLSTAAAALYQQNAGAHNWQIVGSGTAGTTASFTQAMTLDASGNLGVGQTSPTAKIHATIGSGVSTGVKYLNAGGSGLQFYTDSTASNADAFIESPLTGVAMIFKNGGSERARIDSSGSFFFGTTSSVADLADGVASTNGAAFNAANPWFALQNSGASNFYMSKKSGYTDSRFVQFNVAGGSPGSITTNGTTTAYNTSSDYRLKENIQPMTGALAKVIALKPVTYTWKSNGAAGEGFIAHELQAIVPDAVHGEKDDVNEDGSIKPQGIDTSFLVATLTAAIKELKAEFDAYKATHP